MIEIVNPFKYGLLVTGKDFADREIEMNEMPKEIRSGTNMVLFSPRRMGKPSPLAELMHRHGVEFSVGEPTVPEIQDMLDIPEEIARKRGKRIVVVFDEFQEIASLDVVSLLKAMRSRMQAHKHVSYIFAGSKRHLLMSMFEEREGAFFKSAKPLELGPMVLSGTSVGRTQ